jgi:hypothetical protein
MLGLWPGGKGVTRRKHRPFSLRISDCGFRIFGFSFSIRIPQSTFRICMARPFHGIKGASWFLRVMPLRPGRARPQIQSTFRLLGEK